MKQENTSITVIEINNVFHVVKQRNFKEDGKDSEVLKTFGVYPDSFDAFEKWQEVNNK